MLSSERRQKFVTIRFGHQYLVPLVKPDKLLDAKVDELVKQIVANSPTAIRLGKTAFRSLWDMSLAEAFEYTQLMIERIGQTEDARDGLSAFVEKRTPEWTGK